MSESICFVALNAYPLLEKTSKNFIGGAELQQLIIAKELAERGYSVTFITLDHGQGLVKEIGPFEVLATFKPTQGIPVLRFFYPRLIRIWQALNRSKADIYYVRCAGFILAVVVFWARLNHKKVIFCGADDPDFKPEELKFKYARDKFMYLWGLKRCAAIVVQNSHQKDMLRKNFMRSSTLINNGMEKLDGISKDRETILWVANIKASKGPTVLIELAKQTPNEKFVMIGGKVAGQEELFEYVTEESEKLPNLDFKGFLPFEETETEFAKAKLFVNTSVHEGFPNSFLQAWRQGIPVLSFLDPDGLIKKFSLGRAANDKKEMADLLQSKFFDKGNIDPEAIQKAFNENLAIEKQVDKYEALFDSLMERSD